MNKIIVLDETNGKSDRGSFIRKWALMNDIPYFYDIKELKEYLSKRTSYASSTENGDTR